MIIGKARLRAIVKEELTAVLYESATAIPKALTVFDAILNGKGSVASALEGHALSLGISVGSVFIKSPYAAAILFMVGSVVSATEMWRSMPESHPLKVKHRAYLKRAGTAKQDERRRTRIAKYGYDPKEEVFKKHAVQDAKHLLMKLYGPKPKTKQVSPEDEKSLRQFLNLK
jgi:hypothetical protein